MNPDHYRTPEWFLGTLDVVCPPDLDPCASSVTPDRCTSDTYYTEGDDGLSKPWKCERVFLNPPYSDTAPWLAKCREAAGVECRSIVALVLATWSRHDWHGKGGVLHCADGIWVPRGRFNFIHASEDREIKGNRSDVVMLVYGDRWRDHALKAEFSRVCPRPGTWVK